MLDQLLGHPWNIRWFPREYVSVGPKEVDELEFLFVTSPAPMMAVLESSPSYSWIVFMPTPLVGLTDDWLGFLEGVGSLSESSLAAASILLTELGTRIVEA